MEIKSKFKPVVVVDNDKFTSEQLTQIPNMASCEMGYAREIGGPCINYLLDQFAQAGVDISECTITTRIYDLKEGNSTHPLNWHGDGHSMGDALNYKNEEFVQYIGHVGPNEIPFEIVDDLIVMEDTVFEGHATYEKLADNIESHNYRIKKLSVGQFAEILATDIHRVLPSVDSGMRMLVIISNAHKFFPILEKHKNKIRDNVSIY